MHAMEANARAVKADRLATLFLGKGWDADTIAALGDVGWALAEQIVNVRPASPETRQLVVRVMRDRERIVGDAWAGLPGVPS